MLCIKYYVVKQVKDINGKIRTTFSMYISMAWVLVPKNTSFENFLTFSDILPLDGVQMHSCSDTERRQAVDIYGWMFPGGS